MKQAFNRWALVCALAFLAGLSACKPPLREAESLLQTHNYAKAERVLRQLLSQDPHSGQVRALLAQASFHTQGPEAAIDELQALYPDYQDDKNFKQVVDALETEFAELDRLARKAGVAELESYLKAKHPLWLRERARWLLARKQGKGFAKLAQSEDPLVQQLALWQAAGRQPEKLQDLLESHADSRLRPAWYQALADVLWQAKRDDEALDLLERWEKELPERHPRRAEILLKRADFAIEAERPAVALQDLRAYLREFPKHSGGRQAIYTLRDKLKPYLKSSDHRFLAEQAYARWMYQSAYAELSQASADSAADLYKLGSYALEAKLVVPAREAFQRLQKFYRGSREAGLAGVGLASIQRSTKAYGEAIKQLQAIKQAYGSEPEVKAAALWEESIVYDFQNQSHKRAAACHELVEADPGFEEAMPALWFALWDDYLQGDYRKVVELVKQNHSFFAKHELRTRFLYWQARAHEELSEKDEARKLYLELSQNPLMDYYTHRAKERLRLLEHGGEDRYATAPYNGYSLGRVPNPGYAIAFRQAIAGDKEAFSELMELYYLQMHGEFAPIAYSEAEPRYQVLYGLMQHRAGRHYETITHFRYPAEEADSYLPATFPLAFFKNIEAEARKYSLNPFLVSGLIWQESQYKPDIQSWVGATGLMQIMPATGSHIAQKMGIPDYKLSDAATNIRMGTWYLKSRLDYFDGNPLLAVASYNAGAGPVEKWKEQFGHLPYDALAESIPYPETRGYVKRVFTSYWIYQALYGK